MLSTTATPRRSDREFLIVELAFFFSSHRRSQEKHARNAPWGCTERDGKARHASTHAINVATLRRRSPGLLLRRPRGAGEDGEEVEVVPLLRRHRRVRLRRGLLRRRQAPRHGPRLQGRPERRGRRRRLVVLARALAEDRVRGGGGGGGGRRRGAGEDGGGGAGPRGREDGGLGPVEQPFDGGFSDGHTRSN